MSEVPHSILQSGDILGMIMGGIDYISDLSHSIHQSGGRVILNSIGQSGEYRGCYG